MYRRHLKCVHMRVWINYVCACSSTPVATFAGPFPQLRMWTSSDVTINPLYICYIFSTLPRCAHRPSQLCKFYIHINIYIILLCIGPIQAIALVYSAKCTNICTQYDMYAPLYTICKLYILEK